MPHQSHLAWVTAKRLQTTPSYGGALDVPKPEDVGTDFLQRTYDEHVHIFRLILYRIVFLYADTPFFKIGGGLSKCSTEVFDEIFDETCSTKFWGLLVATVFDVPNLTTGVCEINTLFDSRRLLHAVTPFPSFQSCGLYIASELTERCVYFADGLHSLRACP